MRERDDGGRIARRVAKAGGTASPDLVDGLVVYIELLRRWNKKINLTALALDPLSDEAVDRLIVEPVLAARRALPGDRLALDVGSGGGSPAIPFALALPRIRLVLVEVKVRKCAFLREVVRQLSLLTAVVENCRIEELFSHPDLHESADIVTIRAVRADRQLLIAIQAFLKPGGRLFWFAGSTSARPEVLQPFAPLRCYPLVPALASELLILEKQDK